MWWRLAATAAVFATLAISLLLLTSAGEGMPRLFLVGVGLVLLLVATAVTLYEIWTR